jgi:serine phosphatase RsbU (regulator of sigma subunit)
MIMSDGVVEAQNASGELFGFDRIAELLRAQTSTAEIATAAQKFGQTDDILVLRVERCAPRTMLHAESQEAYT